jgi:hypothetical protein
MHSAAEDIPFARRFQAVRGAVLRARIAQSLGWGLFAGGTALVALAAADYVWEWAWNVRAVVLSAGMGLALAATAIGILHPLLWWSRPRTAREIETRFPELGQRVRTVVQFSGRDSRSVTAEGVRPTLVTALEEDTDRCVRPLDLRAIVPRRAAFTAAALALIPAALLLVGLLADWQWRLAIRRALLSREPYTTFAVRPGDIHIDQGRDLTLSLELAGRIQRPVTLWTRPADESQAAWNRQELTAADVRLRSLDRRQVEYAVALTQMDVPLDYRFDVGSISGDVHHVTIRYPLQLTRFEATITPPGYTGLQPRTVDGGDLEVIEASRVELHVAFDRPYREAYVLVSDRPGDAESSEQGPPALRVELEPSGEGLSATLQVVEDRFYQIVATVSEGGPLPENRHRIWVRKDQPPRVHFEEPPEAWEVNPIAEVPMRIRVDDDFGVSKAGVVFQIDNGPEQPLVTREFSTCIEPDGDGNVHLTTHAALEQILCLEDFPVTETSAVTYYAYAEDNYPAQPKRTETDLRFLEIRPFLRIFKVGGT